MKRHLWLGLLAALLAVFALSTRAAENDDAAGGINARYLLMDANGRAVSNEDFPDSFQLIAFGYTFCPDICPTTLAEMAVIMDKLGAASARLQPLFITVDPERDSAAQLRTYTAFFHPRIIGLSGSPALVRRAADNFGVRYEKVVEPGAPPEQYAVDHSAGMYLLGPDGHFIRKFAYGMPPPEIAARIGEILASWPGGAGHE
jgi:cytochrome oxidase Cu insertion factor (SCO1/SenC/PrrC family)